jgi:hypothetical protein
MRRRLEASFADAPTTDPWFTDVLAAIGLAAEFAGTEMLPRAEGRDVAVYRAFEGAVIEMLKAFRPEGDTKVSDESLGRWAAMMSGVALGRLGERGWPAFAKLRAKLREEELAGEESEQ